MARGQTGLSRIKANLMALVTAGLEKSKFSGLSEILRGVAETVDANGCILWEVAPGSDLNGDPPKGYLLVLDQWHFDNRILPWYNLPLVGSVSGTAVVTQKPVNVKNARSDGRVHQGIRSTQNDAMTIYSTPVNFPDSSKGTLNLYRVIPKPFNKEEIARIEQLAPFVPRLYQSIREKVSLDLIIRVNRILTDAEFSTRGDLLPVEEINKVIERVCYLITDTFQCIETSIFLEDPAEDPGVYKITGTTWPSTIKKAAYTKDDNGTLTGWVLSNARPMKIFDLGHFDHDKENIQTEYPGLNWNDSLVTKEEVSKILQLESESELRPLSFIAAPVLMGEKVLGVIRCCAPKSGPTYFGDRELSLLDLVATRISQYWSNWLNRREIEEENRSWLALVESIGETNKFAHDELALEVPNERRIFGEALRVSASVIRGAEITDVRLLDEEKQELYFADTHGTAWQKGSKEEFHRRLQRRFPVRETPPKSAGAHVFQTRKTYVIPDVRDQRCYYSETFPDTKRIIVAPIRVADKFFGILDIRGTGKRNFPRHAEAIGDVLGQQLGLYHYLATTIAKLRKADSDLKEHVQKQIQSFEDLEHQLKSPIFQTYARVQALLSEDPLGDIRPKLRAIRGLSGKAKRVAMNTGLFAALARGEAIRPNLSPLRYDDLIKGLIEAATDNELLSEPDRFIQFYVDRGTFDVFRSGEVKVNFDLLDQALNCILDNAGKYSYQKTTVRIYGGLTGTGRFHISVTNKGLRIHANDVRHCIERAWRSEEAQWVTGEGSGIGLWIVDNIMKAHGGDLVITPTTADGITEVKLIFPSTRS